MQATAYGLQTIFLEFAKRTPRIPGGGARI